MTDIKKINIYMGVVGQVYVDKETAKKNKDAAAKNVVDVKHIIYLVDHEYEDEFIALNDTINYPLTMDAYINCNFDEEGNLVLDENGKPTLNDENPGLAQVAKTNAETAQNNAATIKALLEQKLTVYEDNPEMYAKVKSLFDALKVNDYDGDYTNGGNVKSAEYNVKHVNVLIDELLDILIIAKGLLADNIEYYDQCVVAYDNAVDTFNSYVAEEPENQADKSDKLEAELIRRINAVAAGLVDVQDTTDAINQVTEETEAELNRIEEDEQEEPIEPKPVEGYYWYIGTTYPTDPTNEAENIGVNKWTKLTSIPAELRVDSDNEINTWYVAIPHEFGFQAYDSTGSAVDTATYTKSLIIIGNVEYDLFTGNNEVQHVNAIFKS